MAEFGAPSIGMSNSRTISIEETTKRKFSFSVEDLARSDAKAPESPRQTLNDSLAARAIEGDRFVAQAASESCTPSSSSTADKRNQSKGKAEFAWLSSCVDPIAIYFSFGLCLYDVGWLYICF